MPFAVDQPFWAKRMHLLGVAPAPIPRKQLTAAVLAAGISHALGDPSIRGAAARLGDAVAREDGVAGAIAYVEGLVA